MDIESLLRRPEARKRLVLAAEAAVNDARASLPEKSQLNRLVTICRDATCAEEITSYLRYQASRKSRLLAPEFADAVIAKIQDPLEGVLGELSAAPEAERDRARVAAWRLYAVFLVRAFTYAAFVRDHQKAPAHDRARR